MRQARPESHRVNQRKKEKFELKKAKNESKSGVNWCLFVVNLKKQTQFAVNVNELKINDNNEL